MDIAVDAESVSPPPQVDAASPTDSDARVLPAAAVDGESKESPVAAHIQVVSPKAGNGPISVRLTDRFGFFVDEEASEAVVPRVTTGLTKEDIRLENLRLLKWNRMLSSWDSVSASTVKERARKGIPEALRGQVWMKLVGADRLRAEKAADPNFFINLSKATDLGEYAEVIDRDIPRTFPKHAMFCDSAGQAQLARVLRAYAAYDRETMYCQGMSFIAATFLSYMPEEDAFFMMIRVLQGDRHHMAAMFRTGMTMVYEKQYTYQKLLESHLPRLAAHLKDAGVHPTMYTAQWIITVFTYNFPFDLVMRVWDAFLVEGWKIPMRFCLALMSLAQKDLLATDFEGILTYFRLLPTKFSAEDIIKAAYDLSLSHKEIDRIAQVFETLSPAERMSMGV